MLGMDWLTFQQFTYADLAAERGSISSLQRNFRWEVTSCHQRNNILPMFACTCVCLYV